VKFHWDARGGQPLRDEHVLVSEQIQVADINVGGWQTS
jgi:hypothetical protein